MKTGDRIDVRFLIVTISYPAVDLDGILHNTTDNKRRGIEQDIINVLEDLNDVDDIICLLSITRADMHAKLDDLGDGKDGAQNQHQEDAGNELRGNEFFTVGQWHRGSGTRP